MEVSCTVGRAGGTMESCSRCSVTIYITLSMEENKKGGNYIQPIGTRLVTATNGGSDVKFGKGTANFSAQL